MVETVLFALGLIIICATGAIVDNLSRVVSKVQFPPISDDEFIARCGPGTNPEVALKVRKIVADRLGVDYERVYPSSRFVEDLGAD